MRKRLLNLLLFVLPTFYSVALAQSKSASLKVNSSIVHQKITGFGGFVNSPQFGYNHMTEAEIRKLWGKDSEAGYNIMRLYLPIGESNWSQSLNTAKLAKSLGLTIFASPWSMPTEWKTYNIIGSKYDDNGVKRDVYLKEEHYGDYAAYLNNYVSYLRNNGVELDAISLQNEPDYQVDYAGCIWTPAQMAKFIKEYGHLINCKIIAPETVGITDNYVNGLMDPAVLSNFEIYGGHQYGAIQAGLKNMQAQGKEVWMTEYLINWNADENTSRNTSWSKDAFSFANKLNDALLANVNAWIHYAAKRYYGMMGDGTFGSTNGAITKRGHILSHYAKYVTGASRVENTWNDNSNALRGSSYLSRTGDSVVVVVINPSGDGYSLTVDLPFYTKTGNSISTTETSDMNETAISTEETVRPKVSVGASSITTFIFTKSAEREVSQMASEPVYYDKIEGQAVTNTAFGTLYQMSGKNFTLKHDSPLISSNTDDSKGYLKLTEKFDKLIFKVKSLSSTLSYTSANTTLYYINSAGAVRSYNYGTVTFDKRTDFDWVFDISPNTLTEGCTGIIGLRNGNYSSVLSFTFGDVYFSFGNEKGYKFSGIYSKGDSYLMDSFEDRSYTSLDFTATTGISSDADWNAASIYKNQLYYTASGVLSGKTNVVSGTNCDKLELRDGEGDFYAPTSFTASSASYYCSLNGYKMLVLPVEMTIPAGVKVYTLEISNSQVVASKIAGTKIPSNIPVMITGTGNFTFQGAGTVSSPRGLNVNAVNGVYIGSKAPVGSYYLKINGDEVSFQRVTSSDQPTISAFGAYLAPGSSVSASNLPLKLQDAALPVKLVSFSAKRAGNGNLLSWSTAAESNNQGFEIERSTEDGKFEKIGFVAGNGNSGSGKFYSYEDRYPGQGKNYYRLRQVDFDGSFEYSEVRVVSNDLSALDFLAYPSPAENILNIKAQSQNGTLTIFDATGRVMIKANVLSSEITSVDVSQLPSGVYFYQLNSRKGSFIKK